MSEDNWGEDEEPERVMISALEHYSYCPRQCALIHVEQTFDENLYTLRGRQGHERVDVPAARQERGAHIERGLPLWSRRLGLIGKADLVEFRGGVPFPVEYKLGQRREWRYEAIQVCAQGLCLEEMYGVPVPAGAIYYLSSRTRREVVFDAFLRASVEEMTAAVRAQLLVARLPPAPNDKRCAKCSLLDSCLPEVVVRPARLRTELKRLFVPDDDEVGEPCASC